MKDDKETTLVEQIVEDDDDLDKETLNESICDSIKRDLLKIWWKVEHVLFPRCSAKAEKQLKDWDLWGPLLITISLCIFISFREKAQGDVFVTLFIITGIGSSIVTMNGILLGAKLSFLQTICFMGYCMFPVFLGAVTIFILEKTSRKSPFVNLIIAGVALLWSTTASLAYFSEIIESNRKFLIVFPMFLYYVCLCWFLVTV